MDERNLPPADPPLLERCRKVLLDFVRTVDATGGVFREQQGSCHAPLADPEWIDLGEAYVEACAALHREVLLGENPWPDESSAQDAAIR